MKGAVREIRKDNKFIARVKQKEIQKEYVFFLYEWCFMIHQIPFPSENVYPIAVYVWMPVKWVCRNECKKGEQTEKSS